MPQFFLLSESLYQLFKNLSTVLLNYFKSFQFPVDRISKTWYTVRMKLESNRRVAACAAGFALPRYAELPTVGLYLDQSVQFVNGCFRTFQGVELTASMVSNYVKKGYISNPVRKQYSAEQIAYLLFIAVAKSALSMDNITRLFQMQRKTYTVQQAYDYFCDSLESTLQYTFGLTDTMERFNPADMPERMMLRATIIAVTHIIYLSSQFDAMQGQGTLPANGHLALPEE